MVFFYEGLQELTETHMAGKVENVSDSIDLFIKMH